ncbi:MAG: trypsin-like peptidase domain-containing protein [Candidatus Methanomethylophilaceae archaeon]|jgi:hypothetical protein
MFADACEKAAKFTRPVIVSTRTYDGTVTANCGAFIIINDEGWILTAGHMFDSFVKYQADRNKIKEIEAVNQNHRPNPGMPDKKIEPDPKWITNHSFWWAWDGVRLVDAYIDRKLDLAVGRLEPFNPAWVQYYPKFRNPDTMRPGTSVCRLGFPFAHIESEFIESQNAFRIKKGVLPLPLFPNDGIHTRNLMKGKGDKGYDLLYVETSTPGLKGQSGGPIFDRDCNIYALQVQTAHFPLGFQPTVETNGQRVVENQFMNVGLGVHAKTLIDVLRMRHVKFTMEGDESGFRIVD